MSVPLYEKITHHIIEQIKSGELKSGDRVPSEKELSEAFNVSRITSKKALDILAQEQIIERIRGKGSFVSADLPFLNMSRLHGSEPVHSRSGHKKNLIGLILPDFSNSYGLKLLHGIEEQCSHNQVNLLLRRTYGGRQEEEIAIQDFTEIGVDGLIVFPVHGEHYNAELLKLVLDGFPLVLVDRYLKGIPTHAVVTNNELAAQELTEHLLDLGHERIAFLSPPTKNTTTIEERLSGFQNAFAQRGLNVPQEYLVTELYSTLPALFHAENIERDEDTLRSFVQSHPEVSAYVVNEYNLVLILSKVLRECGVRVPEDCSVTCFDSPEDPFGHPYFTHIEQREEEMGQKAVQLLIDQWKNGKISTGNITVDYRIVEGSSTRSTKKETV